MTDREKLIELLLEIDSVCDASDCVECCGEGCYIHRAADHLIANGVKVVGTETDLTGKCGSCDFAKPVRYCRSTRYVECTNEDLLKSRPNRGEASAIRPRTNKGCKRYTRMPKEVKL